MASMACVKWCQTSPSWPAGKWELPCCWNQQDCSTLCFHGQRSHPAELCCTEQLLWAWGERTEDLEPWRMSLSSSFPEFVGSKYRQTWAALPQHPWKHFQSALPTLKGTHFFPQELPCSATGRTWCWAAWNAVLGCLQIRAGSCHASPEHGQKTSAVCTHLPKQVLDWL